MPYSSNHLIGFRVLSLHRQYVDDMNDVFSAAQSGRMLQDKSRADLWFSILEERLEKSPFFLGDEPSVADFHGVFTFMWVNKSYVMRGGSYAEFPKLTKWWQTIREVPAVMAMMSDGVPMIP